MFASVRRCRSLETGEVFAAKFSSRHRYGEDCTKEIHHEIALLSLCSPSPRIVKLHDVFQTPKEFIIVMEYAPGGDMQTIIDDNLVPFESDVVKFVQHVVEALAYIHHRKIAHLDIKPQNLVMMGDFPDCDIKVCDFEISRVILQGREIHEILGTPEYVAPEILHYEPITLAADMWSLGVTTYVLLTGFSPFGGETDQETFLNISRAQVDFPEELFEDISPAAIDFVKRLLCRKPSDRMTAKECLRHPWLANNRAKSSPSPRIEAPVQPVEHRRVGCASCPAPHFQSNQNLRKYLSKSREALFEKVISQQKQLEKQSQKGSNLRKSTLVQQVSRTRRLCESQMSLVSKERNMADSAASGVTRSREKLYGLRSLSKSHEVLNLYKSLVNLQVAEEDSEINFENNRMHKLPGVLKSLYRTATADIGSSNLNIAESQDKVESQNGNSSEEKHEDPISQRLDNGENGKVSEENNNVTKAPRPTLNLSEVKAEDTESGCHSPAISQSDSILTEGNSSTTESDISEEDSISISRITGDLSTEDDEPRFTVAQLVSAYNTHQEIVTKTSLEVTMNSETPDAKISQGLDKSDFKFPTGPNALRLFIPDIKIKTSRKKRMPRKKTGINPPPGFLPDIVTENPSDDEPESRVSSEPKELQLEVQDRLQPQPEPEPEPEIKIAAPVKPSIKKSSSDTTMSKSTVARTVEMFNNVINSTGVRPERTSFCTGVVSPITTTDKIRRKSSPPTSRPNF